MATVSAMFTITDTGDLNGRNLLQRSFFTKDPWTGPTYNAVDSGYGMYHDKHCLPVTASKLHTNTNRGVDSLFPDLVFEEGVQYTLSGKWGEFRTDDKNSLLRFYIRHTDGTSVFIRKPEGNNNVWTSFKLTSTPGKTVAKITATYGYGGVTYIADFKLEVGAAATEWTPAPEDMNTALDDAKEAQELANSKNSVYYQSTTPTAHKVGDTWFDTANDYKIRRWNGSTWAAAELGNQAVGNLDASHINTGTLTAVHIEAGKSQDIAGTIKVYDENDAVKVSLDKDGLMAEKGIVGGWNISETTLESDHVTGVDESGVEHTGKSTLDVEGGLKIVGSSTTAFAPDKYQRGWRPSTPSLWGESYIGPRSISSEYLVANDKTVSNGGFWIPGRNISAWYTLTPRKQIANTGIYFTLYTKGDLSLFWLVLDGKTPEWTAGVKNNVATSLVDYVDSPTAHFINSVQRSQVAPPYTIWLVNGRGVGTTGGRGGVCNNFGQEIQPYINTGGYINIYQATTSTGVAAITANVFWAHIDYPYTES